MGTQQGWGHNRVGTPRCRAGDLGHHLSSLTRATQTFSPWKPHLESPFLAPHKAQGSLSTPTPHCRAGGGCKQPDGCSGGGAEDPNHSPARRGRRRCRCPAAAEAAWACAQGERRGNHRGRRARDGLLETHRGFGDSRHPPVPPLPFSFPHPVPSPPPAASGDRQCGSSTPTPGWWVWSCHKPDCPPLPSKMLNFGGWRGAGSALGREMEAPSFFYPPPRKRA